MIMLLAHLLPAHQEVICGVVGHCGEVFQDDNRSHAAFYILELFAKMLYVSLVPIMGIASTLVLVRSALGIAIKDEESFRATVLREGPDGAGTAQGWISSVIEIRRRSFDSDEVNDSGNEEESPLV
ncbi:hypothetical protein V5O48_017079 [Marasmius crinis-equi]|uniref:Uncharacterized protein n=1 Tax=Marasmius crinis-equi TaxID=585013 RepID=A0ABR3EPY1_9AGAR